MPKSWTEVSSSPQFQALSPTDQEAARNQYFNEVVAPRLSPEDMPLARSQFDRETARGAFAEGVQSGDEARALAAGDTRSKMRPEDISRAYDFAAERGDRNESQKMARAYVDREKADSPLMMGVGDAVRSVARGVPVLGGLADEANAATSALMGGGYQKSLDYQRARDEAYDEAHPVASTVWQLGGGLASGVGIAAKVAPALSAMPRAFALGSGLGGGAALGAADQFTRGEGVDDRVSRALLGGAIGGAAGVAAPVLASGLEMGTNKVVDALLRNGSIGKLGLGSPENDILRRSLMADGTLGERGVQNIASAGPDGMLVDASPNLVSILDTAIQRSGGGAQQAKAAIESRVGNATKDVTKSLDATLGRPAGVTATETGIRQGTSASRSAAYDAAYNAPIDYARPEAMSLQDLLKRVPGNIVNRANQLMKLEGEQSKQIMAHIADDGAVTYERLPDVRQLDYITRALNNEAKAGEGAGSLGGQTDLGRAFGNLSRDIRGAVKDLVPEYATALDTAAQPIRAREALRLGEGALSPSMSRDAFAEELRGMSAAEKAALKQGVRSHIDDTIANVSRTITDPNVDAREAAKAIKDLSSRAAREKIEMVVGKPAAESMFRDLDKAARAFDLRASVTTNSKTFARGAMDDAIKTATEPGMVGTLLEGRPVNAGQRLVQALTGMTPERRAGQQEQIYGNLVNALTSTRGQDAQKLLQKFAEANTKRGGGQKLAEALGIIGSGAVALPAYQASNRLANK